MCPRLLPVTKTKERHAEVSMTEGNPSRIADLHKHFQHALPALSALVELAAKVIPGGQMGEGPGDAVEIASLFAFVFPDGDG